MQFERPSGSIATRGETANCGRVSFMRNSTDPAAAVACTWNTFFEIDAVDGSLRHGCPLLQLVLQHRKLGTLRCRQGERHPPHLRKTATPAAVISLDQTRSAGRSSLGMFW